MFARRVPLYLLRETVPLYAVGVLTILVLLMIDYFASLLGYALINRPPITLVLQSLADRIPFFISYMLAPALAFALPVGLGRMAKDSELKALYATGVRPISMTWVLLVFGLAVTGLSFLNANYWQPEAEARFKTTWYKLFNAEPSRNLDTKSYASLDGRTIFHAGTIAPRTDDPKTADLWGVVIISPQGTYTATRGLWNSRAQQWELYSPFRTDPEGRLDATPEIRRTFTFEAALEPDARLPENLNLPDLIERASLTKGISVQDSFEANYRLQRRFADPLAALVMAFAGAVFGLLVPNRAFAFAGTIVIVALYWGVWITGQNLAAAQAVPFWLAAWLPPLVFAVGSLLAARRLV
jgi:lipopolysaccharide export system permease protein